MSPPPVLVWIHGGGFVTGAGASTTAASSPPTRDSGSLRLGRCATAVFGTGALVEEGPARVVVGPMVDQGFDREPVSGGVDDPTTGRFGEQLAVGGDRPDRERCRCGCY